MRFFDLPDDMATVIGQIAEDFAPTATAADKNWKILQSNPRLNIFKISTAAFPDRPITGKYSDDRGGSKHAWSMVGEILPPVVVAGRAWYDGRHRVWIAKRTEKKTVEAIDLKEMGMDLIDDVYMGPLEL